MKYSVAKRLVQSVPGAREGAAAALVAAPAPVSTWLYRAARATVFRDNNRRLPTFHAAFAATAHARPDYLEFGVARGTSIISAADIARRQGLHPRLFAFDSFEGLPGGEGNFRAGEMAYTEDAFRRFIRKAGGIDDARVTTIKGFYEDTLAGELAERIGLRRGVHVVHVDCDLYESTVTVIRWLTPLLAAGSVLIFDDWFAFDHLEDPAAHGEQRAFAEWADRPAWSELHVEDGWNIAFRKQ